MTVTELEPPSTRSSLRQARKRRTSVAGVIIAVVLVTGSGTVTYPTAADWFSDRVHATEVSGYIDDVAAATENELRSLRDSARAYNSSLPDGPLRDPYTLNADGSADAVSAGWDDYISQLGLAQDSPMARVRIPEISVDLPIYHGTEATTLDRGVGHLYGSGLPVGGPGTHAVLAGHSGIPSATLFSHLDRLEEGDLFYIDVAGETLTYEVDRITVVLPDDGEELRQVAGHDYVTLLTCTPTGVNSHRLLVRGERIETGELSSGPNAVAPNSANPGFPWWVLPLAGAIGFSALIAWPRRQEARGAATTRRSTAPSDRARP